ncbi:chorismate synthase [Listeria seeligeri]|uniref:chorismate synthase n=1 Tax=Listeria seeligeri TaxID=1640 RepID=UPI001623D1BF|nr:chorismate synthase [Listeria seeligeri]MBC1430903.1 chorismate synthase [Listeria seeligeri]MBC1725049.1 chorismate synthase [Listeria seeligeri]MBC1734883.1 chorismate synthase [Listeria seeligeri]MBC1738687.1 chorismate synthase [Listeria seeligeri]MBC2224894.1 chorismate synthase [Listeria seeligeri]
MGLFDFAKTPTEKKRDDYDKLHDYLKDAIKEHDEKMADVESDLKAYKNGMPDMPNKGIPANPFMEKNDKVLERLEKYVNKEKDKRKSLTNARDKAHQKYLEYKAMAVKEEAAEKAKKEKEKKEREERRKNG